MDEHNEITCVFNFFTSLGWRFYLNDEETVAIEFPEEMTIDHVALALAEDCRDRLVEVIEEEARLARQQFIGGPHNGKPHRGRVGQRIGIRERRYCYSVYLVAEDGRAFFQGWASSRCDALQGKVSSKPAN